MLAISATTIRLRNTDTRTFRRQTSSRSRRESTVHRRTSTAVDVQVSMMPDLSQDISTEQTTWEEIMEIKAMPVPMSQKKEMKAKILVSVFHSQQGITHPLLSRSALRPYNLISFMYVIIICLIVRLSRVIEVLYPVSQGPSTNLSFLSWVVPALEQ